MSGNRFLEYLHRIHTDPWERDYAYTPFHKLAPTPVEPETSLSPEARHELFDYTTGKWLFNEKERLKERKHVFNIDALIRLTALKLGRPLADFGDLVKMYEGRSNRIYHIGFIDGTELIARVPYRHTGPPALAVSNEVATMNLLRHLGFPVPRVILYSANARTAVGAEFIVLEKQLGRKLSDALPDMTRDQLGQLIEHLVHLEKQLADILFPVYGSLFYKSDLPKDMATVPFSDAAGFQDLCIGPLMAPTNWYKGRNTLNVNCGPFQGARQVMESVGIRELRALDTFYQGQLVSRRVARAALNANCDAEEERMPMTQQENKVEGLADYLRIVQYLVPSDEWLLKPVLRHPKLIPRHIYVNDKLEVVGLLDWRYCCVMPRFLAAGSPEYLRCHDDQPHSLEEPEFPRGLEYMNRRSRDRAFEDWDDRWQHWVFMIATQRIDPERFRVFTRPSYCWVLKLFHDAAEFCEENKTLRAGLVHAMRHWDELIYDNGHTQTRMDGQYSLPAVPPCPLFFTELEAQRAFRGLDRHDEATHLLDNMRNHIGIDPDGWVSPRAYLEAVHREAEIRRDFMANLNTDADRKRAAACWPFANCKAEGCNVLMFS
ncbi:hypothetical protein AYL99_11952 [Fonsecaea erecta]|uniref:Aminoglycoside phosphotransferase domain-containing protein n=1 Tax=Fonsecaea erecta TaxID=1367422 RepID=A0A178Z203_9EURO|nr:hypothetical protein AYL99_11952 [Fonsecaea erecta]OAP53829.1 hypothetical protein AYL99_11952 [Fonsecaea erecta]